tara:strand:+ start:10151 stop:11917 length:1767 start_codon:yes stop_codon:yes gene_type:complete
MAASPTKLIRTLRIIDVLSREVPGEGLFNHLLSVFPPGDERRPHSLGASGIAQILQCLAVDLDVSALSLDASNLETCEQLRQLLESFAYVMRTEAVVKTGSDVELIRNQEHELACSRLETSSDILRRRPSAIRDAISAIREDYDNQEIDGQFLADYICPSQDKYLHGMRVESSGWLPNVLDPSPKELAELQRRARRLANAIGEYNSTLKGRPLSTICKDGSREQQIFTTLLERLETLGSWTEGNFSIRSSMHDFEFDWVGWPGEVSGTDFWGEQICGAFYAVSNTLIHLGFPCEPGTPGFEISFKEYPSLQYEWRSSTDPHECTGNGQLQRISQDATIVADMNFPELGPTFYLDGEAVDLYGDGPASAGDVLEVAGDNISLVLDSMARSVVRDRWGKRSLCIDLTRIRRFHGYTVPKQKLLHYLDELTESNPFETALELESHTGVRLRDGGDPVWLLTVFENFKRSAKLLGEQASFADYCRRLHGEKVQFEEDLKTLSLDSANSELATVDSFEFGNAVEFVALPDETDANSRKVQAGRAEAKTDDALPKSKRANSPSRVKARSAYDYHQNQVAAVYTSFPMKRRQIEQ